MEINYNLILKYLGSHKQEDYSINSQKNIITYSNKFPSEFRSLFTDKFYSLGVSQKNGEKNISFYTSFITLVYDDFITFTTNEENVVVDTFCNDLINCLKTPPNNLKDIPKGAFKKYIKDLDNIIWIYELIANKFKINMLIFDFKNKEIYSVYANDIMDPWKPTLLFAKYEHNWEPIRNNEKKMFSYNDPVIKKILNSDIQIKYFDGCLIKKEFSLLDNLNEIIDDMTTNNTIKNVSTEKLEDINESPGEDNSDSDNKIFIKKDTKEILTESKMNKMTKEQLIDYLKKLDVKPKSKATKKDLITMILENN